MLYTNGPMMRYVQKCASYLTPDAGKPGSQCSLGEDYGSQLALISRIMFCHAWKNISRANSNKRILRTNGGFQH